MKIHEILNKKIIKGDVGVEIECEGRDLPNNPRGVWSAVPDGSLRDGIEYVYSKPLPIKDVEESLTYLNKVFKECGTKLNFSFRTSTHVHVNCLGVDYNHILNYIYTYLLLEGVLMNYCGEGRKCNRFCLRLEDAEGMMGTFRKMFQYRNAPPNLRGLWQTDEMRYAALNVEALVKYGSIEFRAMRGTTDPEVLVPWVHALYNMREFAQKFDDPKDIYQLLLEIGPSDFFSAAVGEEEAKVIGTEELIEEIMFQSSMTIDLPYTPFEEFAPVAIDWNHPSTRIRFNGRTYDIESLTKIYGEDVKAVLDRAGIVPELIANGEDILKEEREAEAARPVRRMRIRPIEEEVGVRAGPMDIVAMLDEVEAEEEFEDDN